MFARTRNILALALHAWADKGKNSTYSPRGSVYGPARAPAKRLDSAETLIEVVGALQAAIRENMLKCATREISPEEIVKAVIDDLREDVDGENLSDVPNLIISLAHMEGVRPLLIATLKDAPVGAEGPLEVQNRYDRFWSRALVMASFTKKGSLGEEDWTRTFAVSEDLWGSVQHHEVRRSRALKA